MNLAQNAVIFPRKIEMMAKAWPTHFIEDMKKLFAPWFAPS
jgi:hypothetical protein